MFKNKNKQVLYISFVKTWILNILFLSPRFSPVWTNIGIINSKLNLNNWLKTHHETICMNVEILFWKAARKLMKIFKPESPFIG